MPTNMNSECWGKLKHKLEPATVADGEIQEVSVSLKNGGILAKTTKPRPTADGMDVSWEQMPKNEEVFVYEDFGTQIKKSILGAIKENVESTPPVSSIDFTRSVIDESSIKSVFKVEVVLHNDNCELYEKFANVLDSTGQIDDPDEFAYGYIDKCFYSEVDSVRGSGWEFDGTLYKYTDKPYEWWSEPSNMDDWVDFAADNERQKEQVRNRDEHVVHFHPMEYGLSEDHPYIEWYKTAEELMHNKVKLSGSQESFRISRIGLDELSVTITASVTV